MSRLFFVAAIILFFFAAVGVSIIPNPTAWGLVSLSIGLAVTGVPMGLPWKKAQ
jgi:hypothetical protein